MTVLLHLCYETAPVSSLRISPVAYRLSAAALQTMKRDEPDVAADFYEFMVRILAERVVNCNKSIRALSE